MKEIIESALEGNLQLERETLSDGSRVYNVLIGSREVPCESYTIAMDLFVGIVELVNSADLNNPESLSRKRRF